MHITTKSQGSEPLQNGTNSSLVWIEGHQSIDAPLGAFDQVTDEKTFVCPVLKITFFSLHLTSRSPATLTSLFFISG